MLLATGLLLCGCGSRPGGDKVILRAQEGLARIQSGTITVHAALRTPIEIKRDLKLRAEEVPLSKLELTRWTSDARRLSCEKELECARADLDARKALRSLGPLLPPLPVDASAIHDARLDVAIGRRDRRPRFLRLSGKVETGTFLGDAPFEIEIDLPPS